MRTSFIYHMISALFGLLATLYLLYILFLHWKKMKSFQIASLLFLMATAWAIQGVLYFAEEFIYDFYPLAGKTDIGSQPVDRNKFLGLF